MFNNIQYIHAKPFNEHEPNTFCIKTMLQKKEIAEKAQIEMRVSTPQVREYPLDSNTYPFVCYETLLHKFLDY